jgi:HSP20 family protein
MNTTQEVANRDKTATVQSMQHEQEFVLRPAVDISEDAHGITVLADMPGVSKDRLNVQVDQNQLLIEGSMAIDLPTGMEALYADVRATRYGASFQLSAELETDRIEANLVEGVLSVRIPKRAEFRPRRIEVQAD